MKKICEEYKNLKVCMGVVCCSGDGGTDLFVATYFVTYFVQQLISEKTYFVEDFYFV